MKFKYNPNIYTGSLDPVAVHDAIEHAKEMFPNESCGAIINDEYIRFKNESDTPESQFEIKDSLWFSLYVNDEIDCIVHSHNDYNKASLLDQQQQQELCIPSLIINLRNRSVIDCIVFGEDKIVPLEGRPFFYGVFDCFSLVRDYLKLNHDVIVPNPPHEWEFWADGIDLIEQSLSESPLIEIDLAGPYELGDVLFYNHGGTKYINHMAVICGKSLAMHHVLNNCSGKYPIMFMRKYLTKVMRIKK